MDIMFDALSNDNYLKVDVGDFQLNDDLVKEAMKLAKN
jgi:hypothetical protein